MNVRVEGEGAHNPHSNAFFAEETVLRSEAQAGRDVDPMAARHWLVRREAGRIERAETWTP